MPVKFALEDVAKRIGTNDRSTVVVFLGRDRPYTARDLQNSTWGLKKPLSVVNTHDVWSKIDPCPLTAKAKEYGFEIIRLYLSCALHHRLNVVVDGSACTSSDRKRYIEIVKRRDAEAIAVSFQQKDNTDADKFEKVADDEGFSAVFEVSLLSE